jgi:hypothetical protein
VNNGDALRTAIEIFYLPSQVRTLRSSPLPKGTNFLLRLAAGDAEAVSEAQLYSDRPSCARRQAAIFFIEQILLAPDSDEYRILGLDRTAGMSELRAHMALLLKWLHPDFASDNHRSRMARRVIEAWTKIKTSERQRRSSSGARPTGYRSRSETATPRLIFQPRALLSNRTNPSERRRSRYQPMQSLRNIGRVEKIKRLWRRFLLSKCTHAVHCQD